MEITKRPLGRPRKSTEAPPLPTLAGSLGPADLARVLRTKEACRLLGVGRSTLHRMVQTGRLPAPLHISERCRGWRLTDLLAAQQAGG